MLHIIIYISLYYKGIFDRANWKELKKGGRKIIRKICIFKCNIKNSIKK